MHLKNFEVLLIRAHFQISSSFRDGYIVTQQGSNGVKVNGSNEKTQEDPFNPNFSFDGMKVFCSEGNCYVSMMPNSEFFFTA